MRNWTSGIAATLILAAVLAQIGGAQDRRQSVTVTGCVVDTLPASGARVTVPAAGPAAGTNSATLAEKEAERSGNVPDPHEGPAAKGEARVTIPGGDRVVAETRSGREGQSGRGDEPGSTANIARESGAHEVYFIRVAPPPPVTEPRTPAASAPGRAMAYRLEGDSALIASHLNRSVRIDGTVQPALPATAPPQLERTASLHVERITVVAPVCEPAAPSGR